MAYKPQRIRCRCCHNLFYRKDKRTLFCNKCVIVDTSREISEEDIEKWKPFFQAYLKKYTVPLSTDG